MWSFQPRRIVLSEEQRSSDVESCGEFVVDNAATEEVEENLITEDEFWENHDFLNPS